MKNYLFLVLLLLSSLKIIAQEDLLKELDDQVKVDSSIISVFKGLKIVNLESTKLVAKKDFYFVIAHRFGSVKGGIKQLFGLDQSSIRFSFIFGLTDNLNVGVSRSSFNKTYDFTIKYKIINQQENSFPFTIVGFNGLAINSQIESSNYLNFEFKHRLAYISELLISRKVNDYFSIQIVPIIIHENYVENIIQDNTQYALGGGLRYKISNFISLSLDYVNHLNRAKNSLYNNPLSIGVDIETGGHIFQLIFSNAQTMYDSGFITNASGDWGDGNFFFGFNLSRVF
ncbi:MAG: DUF5777 family beta-barrel protein [Lutibacter sp.]|uniref:DUF5777 family beta-barrel protein n=1 Tax=Lutibacter sp. TaxID=1925666 RepID=UPI00385B4E0A